MRRRALARRRSRRRQGPGRRRSRRRLAPAPSSRRGRCAPPPSVPWATTTSTPAAAACTPRDTEPTSAITLMSRSWQSSTNHLGTSNVSTIAAGRASSVTSTCCWTAPGVTIGAMPRSLARSSGVSALQRSRTDVHEVAVSSRNDGGTSRLTANGARGPADGLDLGTQVVGEVADAPEATHRARFADRGHERGLRDPGHAGRHDRVLDAEQLRQRGLHRAGSCAVGERGVQIGADVGEPGRLRVGSRPSEQLEVQIGEDDTLPSGVVMLDDDTVVEAEQAVDRAGDERGAGAVDGSVVRDAAAADERGDDDIELVLQGPGVGAVADPVGAPPVPRERRAQHRPRPR